MIQMGIPTLANMDFMRGFKNETQTTFLKYIEFIYNILINKVS